MRVELLAFLIPAVTSSFSGELVIDGVKFDFTPLKGDHSIVVSEDTPPTVKNTTWSMNPTGPLSKDSDTPIDHQCPLGTQICGITTVTDEEKTIVSQIIPVAGDIYGRAADPKATRLKGSLAHGDEGKEGVRLEMGGGEYLKEKQQASVEFLCDEEAEDEDTSSSGLGFVSYEQNLLKLRWRTKYACEKRLNSPGGRRKGGWSFFTWLVLIIFIAVAAYLILGSFFNYNRYGTVGFDLLPHSETIRDLPYLLKDWGNAVVNTFKGGSRGGYTSV